MITNGDLAYALKVLKDKQGRCRTYANYFAGDQDLSFATDKFRNAFGYLFREFSYNRCRSVVNAFDDRLNIRGWESDGQQDDVDSPLEKAAADIWRRNTMETRQSEVHAEALRSGAGYLIVWPNDDGEATFYPNHNHLVAPVYDDESCDEIAFAVKTWREERGENAGKWRVTVYEPGVISRWITTGRRTTQPEKMAHLMPYDDGTEAESENPYGIVPVFAFTNGKDDDAGELKDVVPLQDAVNKQVADMMVALEFLGWPQRVIAGLTPENNPETGKTDPPFDVGQDRLILLSDPQAKWGEFAQAAAEQFTTTQDNFDLKISRVSQVPVHWLNQTGDPPSGESLKTAESPFVSKVVKRQTRWGGVWAKAMRFALEIDAVSGDTMGIQPIWTSAESRSEKELLDQLAMKRALNVPEEQLWREMSYTVEEIEGFKKAAEQKRQQQLEQFSQSFDRGQAPVGGN